MVGGARWPIRPRPATCIDGTDAPEKPKVGRSTSPLATPSEQRKRRCGSSPLFELANGFANRSRDGLGEDVSDAWCVLSEDMRVNAQGHSRVGGTRQRIPAPRSALSKTRPQAQRAEGGAPATYQAALANRLRRHLPRLSTDTPTARLPCPASRDESDSVRRSYCRTRCSGGHVRRPRGGCR